MYGSDPGYDVEPFVSLVLGDSQSSIFAELLASRDLKAA